MPIIFAQCPSPVGTLHLYAQENYIIRLDFAQSQDASRWLVKYFTNIEIREGSSPVIEQLMCELDEYFAGERRVFDVPCRLHGTVFQRGVWEALRGIPYGQTVTYGALAAKIGAPGASLHSYVDPVRPKQMSAVDQSVLKRSNRCNTCSQSIL